MSGQKDNVNTPHQHNGHSRPNDYGQASTTVAYDDWVRRTNGHDPVHTKYDNPTFKYTEHSGNRHQQHQAHARYEPAGEPYRIHTYVQ